MIYVVYLDDRGAQRAPVLRVVGWRRGPYLRP